MMQSHCVIYPSFDDTSREAGWVINPVTPSAHLTSPTAAPTATVGKQKESLYVFFGATINMQLIEFTTFRRQLLGPQFEALAEQRYLSPSHSDTLKHAGKEIFNIWKQ